MPSNLNLHSAYFAQIDALVADRGSLKVVHQAMWQMDMLRHACKQIAAPKWDGIGIDCG